MRYPVLSCLILVASIVVSCAGPTKSHQLGVGTQNQVESAPLNDVPGSRPWSPFIGDRWIGAGVSYGPYRDGQSPDGGPWPSKQEVREDLHILKKHWNLLRMYGARGSTETVLEVIREDKIPMKVMVGAWIAPEAELGPDGKVVRQIPEAVATNRAEVETAIRLANEYPESVIAVSVGNETQVFWSFHKVRAERLIHYIRQVRSGVKVPVTSADDFTYWDKLESKIVADEVDFIVMHVYPMWCGQALDNAMPFTKEQYKMVSQMHPDLPVVIGEAGWATQVHSEGEQARLIRGVAGEPQQKQYCDEFVAWTTHNRIATFYFEAFDENWKGGEHPDEVEKHWGLFRADRTPKLAMEGRE